MLAAGRAHTVDDNDLVDALAGLGINPAPSSSQSLLDVSVLDLERGVDEPDKNVLIYEMKLLGNKLSKHLGNQFRLQQRGSLFSPFMQHVSDADLQLFSTAGKVVTPAQCSAFIRFCKDNLHFNTIFTVRWHLVGGDTEEVPFDSDFEGKSAQLFSHGIEALVATGIFKSQSGFLLPIDMVVSCQVEMTESNEHRKEKIFEKFEKRDFAKAIIKVRTLFKKGPDREGLNHYINTELGKLRFLVTQLRMIVERMQHFKAADVASYLQRVLLIKIATGNLQRVLEDCEKELQERAIFLIRQNQVVIARKLGPISQYL